MKRAIYGGSFNPIHLDHVRFALRFCELFDLDRVTFMPTRQTPLKDNSHMADGEHRYKMCKLATADHPQLEVSDLELRREGVSYTSDTVAAMIEEGTQLYLIMGADMYVTLDRWHDFRYILDNTVILVAPRGELDYDSIKEKYAEYKEKYGCRTLIAREGIGGLSSTAVREAIASGADLSGMLDPRVAEYIIENGLYR